ncbi:MAG: hypothetical protein JSS81_01455 [Acidobacteria bacterium]|nr:hypothetical protein [Acidobacteriota bacterium]
MIRPILFCFFLFCLLLTVPAQRKPALTRLKDAKIKLSYRGRTAVVDLENTADVTLGSDRWHRYKLYFTAVQNDKVYFLFEEHGGSPMGNPMGYCGGDVPYTLVWLKTDLKLTVEAARSEIFASCAYNGGRYPIGRPKIRGGDFRIVFEEQKVRYQLVYNNLSPELSFTLKPLILD